MDRSDAELRLRLFGVPRVSRGDEDVELGRRKTMALLAYLAVATIPESRERLSALLWPDCSRNSALANLRKALHEIHTVHGELVDLHRRDVLSLCHDRILIDVVEYENRIRDHRINQTSPNRYSDSAELRRRLENLQECRRIQSSPFMEGFEIPVCEDFEEWLFFRREYYTQERCSVLEQTIRLCEQLGHVQDAIPPARELIEIAPLNEDAHRTLIRLLAEDNQRAAAERQYDACVRLLRFELGTSPQKQTTDLIERIRKKSEPRIAAASRSLQAPVMYNHPATIKAQELCGLAAYSLRTSVYHSGGIEAARKYYLEAIDADPECADAYAGLAFSYFSLGGYGVDARFDERISIDIERLVDHALTLDPRNAMARMVRAGKRFEWDWEFDDATEMFAEALQFHPTHADTLLWYGALLTRKAQFDRAYPVLTKAFQLNPTDIAPRARIAGYYYHVGEFERSRALIKETLGLYPNRYILERRLALIDSIEGNHASAIKAADDIVNRHSNNVTRADRVVLYAQAGHIDRAVELCRDLIDHHERGVDGSIIALACHAIGRDDLCLEWLDKAIDQRQITCLSVNTDAGFGNLHFDPDFQQRTQRIGLPHCPDHIARILAIRAAFKHER